MSDKLSELKAGDKAEILAVNAKGEIRRRLLDLGVVKGLNVKVVRKAPLGDPIEISFRGCHLTLRLEEAEDIHVNKIGEVGDGKRMNGHHHGKRGFCGGK